MSSHPFLFLLSICKQFPNIGLRFTNILVEDLWSVDYLWLSGIQHLTDLPGHQCFTTARRTKEQDAFHMLTAYRENNSLLQLPKTHYPQSMHLSNYKYQHKCTILVNRCFLQDYTTKWKVKTTHTHLLHNVWRENSRGKSPAEDIGELLV